MEREVEVHAYHGWGFNAQFWKSLKSELPNNILLKPADRGYFGGDFAPEFDVKSKHKVLFLHSFGVHWCPIQKMEEVETIIIFNGFDSFLPLKNPAKSRSKKVLNGMETQFKVNPDVVLKAFYKNCFGGTDTEHPNLNWKNKTLLQKDLSALHKTKLKLSKRVTAEWFIIDSIKDRIVSGARGQELKGKVRNTKYHIIEGVHALPTVNPSECIKIISEAFPIFKPK